MQIQKRSASSSAADLQMSAMIDIVFLLLIFFIMTFRIVPQEGDFAIDASAQSGQPAAAIAMLPLHVHLAASSDGALVGIELNGRGLASLNALQTSLIELSADQALGDARLTLKCDPSLKYDHVISTLDAVTGYHDEAKMFQPLIANVSFVDSN